jgi:hypothetical protein
MRKSDRVRQFVATGEMIHVLSATQQHLGLNDALHRSVTLLMLNAGILSTEGTGIATSMHLRSTRTTEEPGRQGDGAREAASHRNIEKQHAPSFPGGPRHVNPLLAASWQSDGLDGSVPVPTRTLGSASPHGDTPPKAPLDTRRPRHGNGATAADVMHTSDPEGGPPPVVVHPCLPSGYRSDLTRALTLAGELPTLRNVTLVGPESGQGHVQECAALLQQLFQFPELTCPRTHACGEVLRGLCM